MARFCPLDQRLSPSEYARAADRMFMLSFANSSSTRTMTRNGQMICNRRPLPGRRTNILRSEFLPQRVPSVFIGLGGPSCAKHNSFRSEKGHPGAGNVSQTRQLTSGNPSLEGFRTALRNARDVHPDLVDAGARGDVQRLVVGVAELYVGDELGREDRAQMLALGRYDPHPACGRFPDVALDVDLQAVGDSGSRIAADVDEHAAVRDGVVGQDAIAPHVLVAAAVRVENFLVGRQGEAVRIRDVVDDAGDLAGLDHVDALEVEALARVLLAQAQAAVGVGEVDGAVALDDDVVRAVELPAFEAVGEDGALAVLLDPVDRPSGPGRDDEPALPVEGEPVRADHVELLEQGIARVLPVGLLEAHSPDVGPGVAAAMHVDGRFAPGRELVDHVGGDVAQQQVAALLDPDEALGKPEAALHQLQPGVGGHQGVERRVESHDGGLVALHLSACSAGPESGGEQDCGGNRRVLHETLYHIPRILPISAMYWPAFRPSATTVSSPFSMAWRKPCKPSLTQCMRRMGELRTFLRVSTSSLNS